MMCPTTKGLRFAHGRRGIGLLAILLTLALTGEGQAQNLSPGATNFGVIDLTGNPIVNGSDYFNAGSVLEESSGGLGFDQAGGGSRDFYNLFGGTYEFLTNSSIYSINCCAGVFFENQGLVRQKGGTNVTTISIPFDNESGTIEVNQGELVLSDGGSSSNGTFSVADGALLDLTGGNNDTVWAGKMDGSGAGQVLLSSGTVIGSPNLTLDFTNDLLRWSGGTLAGTTINAGTVAISGTASSTLGDGAAFYNEGTVEHEGSGGLAFQEAGGGSTTFYNLSSGTYQFTTDTSLFAINCCADVFFENQGLVWQSGGARTTVTVPFDNRGGTIEVTQGTLVLNAGGSSSNGTFAVTQGAALDLTGGSSPVWAGRMNGSGGGQVLLSSGTINASPSLDLDFAGSLFYWSGGELAGLVTNTELVTITGTNNSTLGDGAYFYNEGTVEHAGSGSLVFQEAGGGTTAFYNQPSGIYQFTTDSSIFPINCCAGVPFVNQGLLWKSQGANTTTVSVTFDNLGGALRVDQGNLVLNGGGTSSNGTFTVAAGAALDLTGGGGPTWAGRVSGGGDGQVLLSSGTVNASPSLDLDFAGSLFYWSGGTFAGLVTNTGLVTIAGTSASILGGGASFYNEGKVEHEGTGGLVFQQAGGGTTAFYNQPSGIYQFTTDSSISSINCCAGVPFVNQGLLWKNGGTNVTTVSVTFDNLDGRIEVDAGELVLSGGGNNDTGAFDVAAGAALDLTGGSGPVWTGRMTGSGQGRVLLSSGTLDASPSLNLDFTNDLFQWNGGTLAGVVTNTGLVILTGANNSTLADGASFYNDGSVEHEGSGGLLFQEAGGGTTAFYNLPSGTYKFTTDSFITPINCCAGVPFFNQGLLWKNEGTNTTTISVTFDNLDGAIEVDQGELVLNGGGSSSNGTFNVATGATLDLTGGSTQDWRGRMIGSGAGRVLLSSGTLATTPTLTFDFTNGLFQWCGGTLAGALTNTGLVRITGSNASTLADGASFYNKGTVNHEGAGVLNFQESGGGTTAFYNLPSGVYQFSTDTSINSINCCAGVPFVNQGLVRKSGGTNTASLLVSFANSGGSIEVDSGTLSLGGNDFNQDGGGLTFVLGGENAGQWGQFSLSGTATFQGPLNVRLAQGYVPPAGTTFPLISAGALAGAFTALNLPGGCVLQTNNNRVSVTFNGFTTYEVNATNDPAAGGTISGTGFSLGGASNTLVAAANYGYAFKDWTENGAIIGTSPTLNLIVTSSVELVAHYTATNLTHVITVNSAPASLPGITGAGTYANGKTAVIEAPLLATNSPDYYTFEYFTLNGAFATSNNVIKRVLSTLDRPNISYEAVYSGGQSILPSLIGATDNYGNIVPKTTNLILTFQFDRSMNPSVPPKVVLTNAAAGAVQPVARGKGAWSGTVYANDTYSTPPITLGAGMDGTVQVYVSGSEDTWGHKLALTNALTLMVLSTPPVVAMTAPSNGASFSTTASLTASASASSPFGIAGLALYYGQTLVSSNVSTQISATVSGLAAGSYAFRAVATDTRGLSATSAVVEITIDAPGTTLINFDAVDAAAGPVTNRTLADYLAGYGVTVGAVTSHTALAIENDRNILDGSVTAASSGRNLLTQIGANGPISYTLDFNQPYASVAWTRTELLAGAGGTIAPQWRAYAYNSNGVELASVGESETTALTNIPARRFKLAGAGIQSITFQADNSVGTLNTLPLDDLLLSTLANGETVAVSLSTAGSDLTAPGQIQLTARASDSSGSVTEIDFYEGSQLLGSAFAGTNAPSLASAAFSVSNVAAGTYTFTAVATDDAGAIHSSSPGTVTVSAASGVTVIDFDALNASAGAVAGTALADYLAKFGVKILDVTMGTRVEVLSDDNLSGAPGAQPPSPPNLLTQAGLDQPVRFSLRLAKPVQSFGFTRVGLTTEANGASHPAWTAYALNAAGQTLETVSEPLISSLTNVPGRNFVLTASNITTVRFESDSEQIANFDAVLLDNIILDGNATTNALAISITAPGGELTAPADIPLSAGATDSLGSIVAVNFYAGNNLIGTATSAPFNIDWTNVLAGTYSVTAQVLDSSGYARNSSPALLTVHPGAGPSTLLNFDSLNASAGAVTGAKLTAYFQTAGITVTNVSAGTKLAVENQSRVVGGGFVIAASPSNILTQIGSSKPSSFTLKFSPPLAQFNFTRPELTPNPFVTLPGWEAEAYDSLGVSLREVSEGLISSYTNVPAHLFNLSGPGIASVKFTSRDNGLATFQAVLLDDFILTQSSSPLPPAVVLTNPLPGEIFTEPGVIPLQASAVALNGSISGVSFLTNGAVVSTASAAPFLFEWNNSSAGTFALTAVATDSSGLSRTSPVVNITVTPQSNVFGILTQPVGVTAAAGSVAVLSVATTGTNAVSYQWYFDGNILEGQNGPYLSLYPVTTGNAGTYAVDVSSEGTNILSQEATVTVLSPPVIDTPPASQQVQIGETVSLSVTAGGSGPLSYQWLHNGTSIDGATNAVFTVDAARPFDSGNYQVVAANPVAAAQSPVAVVSVTVAGSLNESADNFADRIAFTPLAGPIFGNNTNATTQPGEPEIDGKPGGKSIWYTWHASFTGVLSLTTLGSSFDTLLGVYLGTNVDHLTAVAADDDSGGYFTSLVTFNCIKGTDYQIAVDGFRGASGTVVLGLPGGTAYRVLSPGSGDAVPVITEQPASTVVVAGTTAVLKVGARSSSPYTCQWCFQKAPIPGATGNEFTINNFNGDAVGNYYVLIANSVGAVQSVSASLQIAAEKGGPHTTADDKFGDAVDLSPAGNADAGSGGETPDVLRPRDEGGDSRGFSLSQTFSTVGATKEPGEPDHCGQPGGASEWYIYTTPAAGTLHVNTAGSAFNTILALYTNGGPGAAAFSNLVDVACDYTTNYTTDGQPDLTLTGIDGGTAFYIVVDGYQGASGTAVLNIGLGQPPVILAQPQSRPGAPGGVAAFSVNVAGTTNFSYQWQFNGASITNATNSSCSISNVQSVSLGTYSVVITNSVGVVTSAPAVLTLQSTPFIVTQPTSQEALLGEKASFTVEAGAVGALSYQWYFNGAPIPRATASNYSIAAAQFSDEGTYTVIAGNSTGSITSAPVTLAVEESSKPSVSITSPGNGLNTTNSSVLFEGTASDKVSVAAVQVVVNSNTVPPVTGTNKWSASVPLAPGINYVTAQSFNFSGLGSTPVTHKLTYIVTSPLTLQTNGTGKIDGLRNNGILDIGREYKVTAVPAPDCLLSNWSGGMISNALTVMGTNDTLSFFMSSNLVLQANFVTNPFPAVAGVYSGLFSPSNGITEESSGWVTVALPASGHGQYSAKISLDGGSYPFSGLFDLTGDAQTTVKRAGKDALTVQLHLDLNLDPADDLLGGSVISTNWTSLIEGYRSIFNAERNPDTNYAARFTVALPPGPGAPDTSPGGYGALTVTNTLNGVAVLAGSLGDGTPISQAAPIAPNGDVPVYVSLYGGKGSLQGWLLVTGSPDPALSGVLSWIKTSGPAHGLYPAGFTNLAGVVSSVYAPPSSNVTNETLTILGGSQSTPLIYTNVSISGNTLSFSGPTNRLTATFVPSTGAMTLTFRPNNARQDITAKGVVLQTGGTNATGWFLSTNRTGYFILQQ